MSPRYFSYMISKIKEIWWSMGFQMTASKIYVKFICSWLRSNIREMPWWNLALFITLFIENCWNGRFCKIRVQNFNLFTFHEVLLPDCSIDGVDGTLVPKSLCNGGSVAHLYQFAPYPTISIHDFLFIRGRNDQMIILFRKFVILLTNYNAAIQCWLFA